MVNHGNTQAQEAVFIGVSTKTLNSWLNGYSVKRAEDVERLRVAYPNLSYADIVGNIR